MSDVFISYSRKDRAFVDRLHQALEKRNLTVWVDLEGILPSAEWMVTIRGAIDEAEAVLFVISPDSIASEICGDELAHAVARNKRLIPVLRREPGAPVNEALARLNYVFARDTDDFEASMDVVASAVATDLDWVGDHTRLLVRAAEWDREGREASFTLRGSDLTAFEDWAARAPDRDPKPTALQTEYLLASRRAVTRRQRTIGGGIAVGLIVAAVLGTVASFQKQESDRQAEIVAARKDLSRAEALREVPATEGTAQMSWANSLRAAASGLRSLDALGEPVFDADRAVRRSYGSLPKLSAKELEQGEIRQASFDPTGRFLVLGYGMARIEVMDTVKRHRHARCGADLAGWIDAQWPSVDALGSVLTVLASDPTGEADPQEVYIWSLPDCTRLPGPSFPRNGERAFVQQKVSGDGRTLVVRTAGGIELWDIAMQTRRSITTTGRFTGFAPSPSDRRLATIEIGKENGRRNRRLRIWDMDTGEARAASELPGGRTLDWSVGGLRAGKFLIRFDDGQPKLGPELPDAKAVISPDGSTYALIVDDQTVEVGPASGDARVRRAVRPAALSALAFSPDGATLSVVNEYERALMFWHVEDRGGFARIEAKAAVRRLAFTTAGDALLAETNTERLSWPMPAAGAHDLPGIPEAESAEEAAEVPGPGGTPVDGTLTEVVTPSGVQVRIRAIQSTRGGWIRELEVMSGGDETRSRTLDMVLNDAEAAFLRLAGGGRYVVLAAQLGFDVIELESLVTVATLYHAGGIDVAVRADGATAVTVGRDLTARVWQIDSGEELNRIALPAIPTRATLSDDGRWLAAAFAGGRIELYALRPADLIAQACRWLEPPCP